MEACRRSRSGGRGTRRPAHPDGQAFSGARTMVEPDRDPVLTVTELTKVYQGRKPTTAVDRLSFALGRGEILGLLGPNGAGKTTTIQMLLSVLKPTAGRIDYFGESLATARETILARVGLARAHSERPL